MSELETRGRLAYFKPDMKFGHLIDYNNSLVNIFMPGNVLKDTTFADIYEKDLTIKYVIQENGKGPLALSIEFEKVKKDKFVLDKNNTGANLFRWADINLRGVGDGNILSRLSSVAVKEDWDFKSNPRKNFFILNSYLRHTFYRLFTENKILYSTDNKYALFNTGLVTKTYDQIDFIFENASEIDHVKQEWRFVDFCTPGQGKWGKFTVETFSNKAKRANYFTDVRDIFYDGADINFEWHHIIDDGVARARYPKAVLIRNGPANFSWSDTLYEDCVRDILNNGNSPSTNNNNFLRDYVDALNKDDFAQYRFKQDVEFATKLASMRAVWNYKTAVITYYSTDNDISLLLPLSFNGERTPDLALVMKKAAAGQYQAYTVYTLEMAYHGARVISQPMSDWLTT